MVDRRDSRVSIILGDASIPDSVSWPIELRDRTCVWLEYIDASFSKCQVNTVTPRNTTTATSSESSTEVSTGTTNAFENNITTRIGSRRSRL